MIAAVHKESSPLRSSAAFPAQVVGFFIPRVARHEGNYDRASSTIEAGVTVPPTFFTRSHRGHIALHVSHDVGVVSGCMCGRIHKPTLTH